MLTEGLRESFTEYILHAEGNKRGGEGMVGWDFEASLASYAESGSF